MKLFSSTVKETVDAAKTTDYTRLYKCAAVICYTGILIQLPNFLTTMMSEFSRGRLVFFLFYLAGVPLGYAVQTFAGKLFGLRHITVGEYTYEDSRRYYKIHQAFLCHLAAVAALLFVNAFLTKNWTLYRSYEDYHSIIPLIVGLGTAFMVEAGGYLWFFPYNALISMRRIGPLGVLALIDFLAAVFNADAGRGWGFTDLLCLLCLYLAVALFLLVLNQSFITRSFGASQLFGVNDNAKRYSVRIVGVFLCIVFGAPFLLVFAMKLVFSILKLLGRASVAVMIGRQPQARAEAPVMDSMENAAGQLQQRTVVGWWLPVLVILGLVFLGIVSYMNFPGFRDKVKELWEMLRQLFRFLRTSHSDWRYRKRYRGENINYVDTEERTRKRSAAFFGRQDDTMSYRDFEKKLDSLPALSEKLCYAYAVAARLLQHQNCQIIKSDTPREIAGKVRRRSLISDIDHLTDVFEQLHYRESVPDASDAPLVLERLKSVVRQYLV